MKNLLFILFVFVSLGLQAQVECNKTLYDKYMRQGADFVAKEKYMDAVTEYIAALTICPQEVQKIQVELTKVFTKVNQLKDNALKSEKKALDALNRLLVILKANIGNALSRYHIVEARGELDKIRTLGISDAATIRSLEKQINDSLKALLPEMVLVKGGTFMMGYDPNRDGIDEKMDNAKPLHEVELDDFWIGKTEVTQALWKKVMGNNPSYFKPPNYPDCPNCPVESVSYVDIQDFLARLEEKTGEKMTLPSEAQWEYAARGGNKSGGFMYAGSNDLGEVAWYGSNSESKTHQVGTRKPNELGLYDMSGNVWEWCLDGYEENFYGTDEAKQKNLINNRAKKYGYFVLRGGSWDLIPNALRVSFRYWYYPTFRYLIIGFRFSQVR